MIYNEIGGGNLDQILQQRFNVKSGGAVAPAIAPEIMPVVGLEMDRPEWSALKGEFWFSVALSAAAVVGNFSFAYLQNTLAANLLIVVREMRLTSTSGSVFVRFGAPQGVVNFTGSQQLRTRDARLPNLSPIQFDIGDCNLTASGNTLDTLVASEIVQHPLIVGPGDTLTLVSSAVNQLVSVKLYGYYRNLVSGELG